MGTRIPEQGGAGGVLFVGVNWLGDAVMTMPALQAHARAYPAVRRVMLTRPHLADVWRLHPAVADVWPCGKHGSALWAAAGRVRRDRFVRAYVFPRSWRAALAPWLGRVPERIGFPGRWRGGLLTRGVTPAGGSARRHQAWEYLDLLGLGAGSLEPPRLVVSPVLRADAQSRWRPDDRPLVVLFPGAARGPSKRWPADAYVALGQRLKAARNCRMVLAGSAVEQAECARLAARVGVGAAVSSGILGLPELAALLAVATLAVGNDSGGVHLAAAVGTPVVAIFGLTDPDVTAPLGRRVAVVQDGRGRGRDIPPESAEASRRLARIDPERVASEALALLDAVAR